MKLNQLGTEHNYWKAVLEPLAKETKLLIDTGVDFLNGAVYCKIVHPNHVGSVQKHPELVTKVDLDRSKRPEAEIRAEIEKAVEAKKNI